jgi:hypothetical protein
LTDEMYEYFYNYIYDKYNIRLLVSPEEYNNTHYYPNSYNLLKDTNLFARSMCYEKSEIKIENIIEEIKKWNCDKIMMKDFVKSIKNNNKYQNINISEFDETYIDDFIEERGRKFNKGIVIKEFVKLKKYNNRGDINTNEWRLLYVNAKLVSMNNNSYLNDNCKKPENKFLEKINTKVIKSKYFTIDVAEKENGEWFILEIGDGGVSGIATSQTIVDYYSILFLYCQ